MNDDSITGQRDRIVRLETQVSRIVADIDSEKETRARSNTHIDGKFESLFERLGRQDRIIYVGIGIIITLQAIGFLHK